MFGRIFAVHAEQDPKPQHIMILRRTAHQSAFFKKEDVATRIGCLSSGLNLKLDAVCDQDGKPICLLLSAGQMSDYKGVALLLPVLPNAQELIADTNYDADWFRQALSDKNIKPCIPS